MLAALLAALFAPSALAERLAEAKPFKTTMTLGFVRSAAFVVSALVLLGDKLHLEFHPGLLDDLVPTPDSARSVARVVVAQAAAALVQRFGAEALFVGKNGGVNVTPGWPTLHAG